MQQYGKTIKINFLRLYDGSEGQIRSLIIQDDSRGSLIFWEEEGSVIVGKKFCEHVTNSEWLLRWDFLSLQIGGNKLRGMTSLIYFNLNLIFK
jgi:hypothetical protein